MATSTISLTTEAKRLVQHLIDQNQFSPWIQKKIMDEFRDQETLELEKRKYESRISQLNRQIEMLKQYEEDRKKDMEENNPLNDMSFSEKEWWDETIEVLQKDPSLMQGRKALYNNVFGHSFNKVQFIELYEAVREKKEEQKTEMEE